MASKEITVKAIEAGYYNERIQEPGDVFTLRDGDEPAPWMEKVSAAEAKADEPKPKK